MTNYLRANWRRIIIVAVVLTATGLGMYQRALWRVKHDLWKDESYQIAGMENSLREAIVYSRTNLQFPGDYVLIYPFYKVFGKNKWGLAIPHIIVTLIGFYLFYILCKKYFRTIGSYLIAFILFACNYNLIYHAFEIRPYSVLVTLSIATFIVIQYIFENTSPPLTKRIFISVFIFVTFLFHMTIWPFLFFSYIFHLLFSRKDKSIGHILLTHLRYYGLGVSFTLLVVLEYLFLSGRSPSGFCVIGDTFAFINRGVISILKGVFGNLTGYRRYYPLLLGIIINFILPHKQWIKQLAFFVLLIIMPIAGILLACFYFHYWFIQRLFICAIPFFAFFVGWCWDSIIVYLAEKNKQYKGKSVQS